MSVPRIYCPIPLQINQIIALPQTAAHHVMHVLRCHVGEHLHVFNAADGEFLVEIIKIIRHHVDVRIKASICSCPESPLTVHLGQAISRGERMDFVVQKAVELGVAAVTPVLTQRCVVKLDEERASKRVQHWQQVAISACEQSGRTVIPTIYPMQLWSDWLRDTPGMGMVCSLSSAPIPLSTQPRESVKLLIGPEGGLTSQEEVDAIHQFGCIPLTLGPRILRTETAALVALTLLQHHWGDL